MHSGMQHFAVEDSYGYVGGKGSCDDWNSGPVTTEWEDALVKHKIISKRVHVETTDEINTKWREEQEEIDELDSKTHEELEEMEDELDERLLMDFRKARIAELQRMQDKNKFGEVREITKPEFITEVTKGSLGGQWVVCCLYLPGNRTSTYMLQCLRNIAARHRDIKFTQIVGSLCIENYPDHHCPTLLIYHDAKAVGHIKGNSQFGGDKMNADIVEYELSALGMYQSDQEENPWKKFAKLHKAGKQHFHDDAEEESDSLDL